MATPSDAPALAAALPDSPAQRRDKILLSSHAPIEEFQKFRDGKPESVSPVILVIRNNFHAVMRNPASRLDIDITHSGGMAEASANNQVVALCSEVHTRVADFQGALEELSIWKNEFLKQGVSSSVKMSVVLLFSRLFRR